MTTDPPATLPALKITTKLSESEIPGHWKLRATAKFLGQDYFAEAQLPKHVYIFSIPTVMSDLVHEVAHQIVVTQVGLENASPDRR